MGYGFIFVYQNQILKCNPVTELPDSLVSHCSFYQTCSTVPKWRYYVLWMATGCYRTNTGTSRNSVALEETWRLNKTGIFKTEWTSSSQDRAFSTFKWTGFFWNSKIHLKGVTPSLSNVKRRFTFGRLLVRMEFTKSMPSFAKFVTWMPSFPPAIQSWFKCLTVAP